LKFKAKFDVRTVLVGLLGKDSVDAGLKQKLRTAQLFGCWQTKDEEFSGFYLLSDCTGYTAGQLIFHHRGYRDDGLSIIGLIKFKTTKPGNYCNIGKFNF
jgi:hypothetical protein